MLNLDGPEKPSKIAGFAIIEASKPGTRSSENRKRYGRPRFYSVLLPRSRHRTRQRQAPLPGLLVLASALVPCPIS